MAEEKKGKSSRGGQKVQSKRSTSLKESKTGATKQAKAQTKGVRSEIKGLVLMALPYWLLSGWLEWKLAYGAVLLVVFFPTGLA